MRLTPTALIFAAFVAFGLSGGARADRLPLEQASMEDCTPQTAEHWTVTGLAQNGPLLIGRCVTVSGIIAHGWHMFADADGIYRHDQADADRRTQEGWVVRNGSPYRIGIQRHEFPSPPIGSWVYDVTVTGRITDCDSRSESGWRSSFFNELDGTGGIVLVNMGGYCHYNYGAMIIPVAIDFGSRRTFTRRTGSAARAEYGSIQPVPSDSPLFAAAVALGGEILDAIEAGDQAELEALFGDFIGLQEGFLSDERTRLGALENGRNAHQWAVFLPSPEPINWSSRTADTDESGSYFCYCRTANCEEQWPISISDTKLDNRRPYVCFYRYVGREIDGAEFQDIDLAIPDGTRDASPFDEPGAPSP